VVGVEKLEVEFALLEIEALAGPVTVLNDEIVASTLFDGEALTVGLDEIVALMDTDALVDGVGNTVSLIKPLDITVALALFEREALGDDVEGAELLDPEILIELLEDDGETLTELEDPFGEAEPLMGRDPLEFAEAELDPEVGLVLGLEKARVHALICLAPQTAEFLLAEPRTLFG
jgi:hypothetical protein